MNHLTEEQLILHYYGESEIRLQAQTHLKACPTCDQAFAHLSAQLDQANLPVPERDPDYEVQLWEQLQSRLNLEADIPPRGLARLFHLSRPSLPIAAAFAAGFLVAVFLGLKPGPVQTPETMPQPMTRSAQTIGADVTRTAVKSHLESVSYFLRDLANTNTLSEQDAGEVRLAAHQFIADNRVYRGVVSYQGDAGMARFLEELEMALLEIANQPGGLEIETVTHEDHTELLFKIKVLTLPKPVDKPTGIKI